ncbi:MAG: hypothetical protein ABI471_04475 [Sphingomonas bacterium]
MVARALAAVRTFAWGQWLLAIFGLIAFQRLNADTGFPVLEVQLDERNPTDANFAWSVPSGAQLTLASPKTDDAQFVSAPRCSSGALMRTSARSWTVPTGCGKVIWSAGLPRIEQAKFDASAPISVWSARHRFWVLTNSLPWLRVDGQPGGTVRVTARVDGQQLVREARLPNDISAPLYIVIGTPVRRYAAPGAGIEIFGDAPLGPRVDQLQRAVVSTLAHWRRDLLPSKRRSDLNFRFVWFQTSAVGAAPGVQASSGSDAILIQFTPEAKDDQPYDHLEAGVLLVGMHEAFHSFGGWMPGRKPAWFNESLATYFAYEAARHHLTGRPLALSDELVKAPAEHSVLHAEQRLEKGDSSDYGIFYSRGTRFWWAIDRILTIRPNASGKLAALLQQTDGFAGVDWNDPKSIARFFDGYSGGKASSVVRCYLVDDACAAANL